MEQLITTLKDARKRKNLSQQALAKKLGVPQSHISKIENGKINPTIASILEIARTLDMELMAIPKKYVHAVAGLTREQLKGNESQQPAYRLDEDDKDA